jgi:DNA helicase-2/ATP-dependent DNA helicase PcrA
MEPVEPDTLLAGLDPQQRLAVTIDHQPLCVLAGAGSGKTRVLTRRIAWRCATGAEDAHHVLALTFTRSAARELSVRLRALGVREGVRAGTFHAVAWSELRLRAAEAGRTAPVLIDRPVRFLARVAELDRATLAAVATELAWARARAIDLEDYPDEARRAARRTPLEPGRIVEIGHDYALEKRRRHTVDFDDLLAILADAMADDPSYAASQRWRFRHLYVDELQDLNPLQHRLLEQWRGGRPSLTAVGDPNQAIYGWNGSDPAFVERFTEHHPDGLVVEVDTNYRSTAPILTVANAVLDAGDLGGVRLRAFREGGDVPRVTGYADEGDEAIAVSRAILDAKLPTTSWGQQAVLARTNQQLDAVEAALQAAHIPTRVRGRIPFHELPAVRAALREFTSPGATLADAIGRLAVLVAPAGDDPDGPAGSGSPDDDDPLVQLLAYAEQYRQVHRADAAGFRTWLVQEADDTIGGDGVELVTFHGAKGREWRVVHVIGAEDGYVPIAWATTTAQRAEERRLFYVAITRAEDHLNITWSASRRTAGGRAATRTPSPYLREVGPVLTELGERERPTATPPRRLSTLSPAAPDEDADRAASLRRWRAVRARASGVADDAVLPERVLREVARACPADVDDLARIPGTGPLLLAGLADEVLASLRG